MSPVASEAADVTAGRQPRDATGQPVPDDAAGPTRNDVQQRPGGSTRPSSTVARRPVAGGADRPALPGLAVAVVGIGLVGSTTAYGAAALLVLAWLVTPPVALAAFGGFLVVAVDAGGVALLASGVGLGLVLLAPAFRATARLQVAATVVVTTAALAVATVLAAATASLVVAAVVLVCGAGALGYAVHRFAVVTVERRPPAEVDADG